MGRFAGDSLSVAKPFADAVNRWTRFQFPAMMREVRTNLTGRMMRRRTGATLANVERHSRETVQGFKVATTSKSLIAWMRGSNRRGFFVRPRRAGALRFMVRGKIVFSRGHFIPPWKFSPTRPVIENAFHRRTSAMIRAYEKEAITALKQVFPDTTVKIPWPF